VSARHRWWCGAALAAALVPATVVAGSFAVTPIRLDFPPNVRTGAITVVNSDPGPLGFQVKLLRWTQNAKGEDVYEESKDLTYFPRLMTLEPETRRVIRLGTQAAAPEVEASYRLAIEEMPRPRDPASGSAVAVQVRFAVPIFLTPKQAKFDAEVLSLAKHGKSLRFSLANRGNQHVKLEELSLMRGDQLVASASGWYVLAGAQREFSVEVGSACASPASPVFLVLKGEGLNLRRDVTAQLDRCAPSP
jgi:fimbrial chaperone protein